MALAGLFTGILSITSLFIFGFLIILLCFFVFNYIFNEYVSFFCLSKLLLFSFAPYILISSLAPFDFYAFISVFSVSIGVLSLDMFFLYSIFLLSIGLFSRIGYGLKQCILTAYISFAIVTFILAFVFYNALELGFLWFVFRPF
ncbi:DUF2070 family protein [Candidatus Woesearchaeota archaeon]|nr:DUF2070 family protein [Candidatus Woesearchaeota archaeon]